MIKIYLTEQEIEDVRVATLRHMEARRIQGPALAHLTGVRYETLKKFLSGERRSPATAVVLVTRLPIGLVYRPPGIVHVN